MFHQLPFSFHFLGTTLLSQSFLVTVIIAEPEVRPFFDRVCFHWFVFSHSLLCCRSFLLYAIHVTVLYSGKCVMSYIFIVKGSCISAVPQCWWLMSLHTLHICFAILIWSHHGLFTVYYCCRFSFLLIHSLSSRPSHDSDCHWTSGESFDGDDLTDQKGMRRLCFLSCLSCCFFLFSLCCACSNTVLLYYTIPYCTCIAQIFLQSCLITPSIEYSALSSSCFISVDQHFSLTMF